MKSVSNQIIEVIESKGGIVSFPAKLRRTRPVGCPMKSSMIEALQSLTSHEIHIAFLLGLIGNSNKSGSIVMNSKAETKTLSEKIKDEIEEGNFFAWSD